MNYEDRLRDWANFREGLSTADDPLQEIIDYYNQIPLVSIHTDPWTPEMWPNPWELIEENEYCEYCIILGMCYTIQLCECFKNSVVEIHIGIDNTTSSDYYLLYVDNKVIGYKKDTYVHESELPNTIVIQKKYPMLKHQ